MPTRAAKWRTAKASTIGVSQRDPPAPTIGGSTSSADGGGGQPGQDEQERGGEAGSAIHGGRVSGSGSTGPIVAVREPAGHRRTPTAELDG